MLFCVSAAIPVDDHSVILVDCGLDSSFLLAELRKRGLDESAVKAILLTHGHTLARFFNYLPFLSNVHVSVFSCLLHSDHYKGSFGFPHAPIFGLEDGILVFPFSFILSFPLLFNLVHFPKLLVLDGASPKNAPYLRYQSLFFWDWNSGVLSIAHRNCDSLIFVLVAG